MTKSMVGWIRWRREKSTEPQEPERFEPSPPEASAAPRQAGPPPSAAVEADFAAALGIDPAAMGSGSRALTPDESALAEEVVAHFNAHRPGLASFPSIAMQVLDVVRKPDAEVAELARLIGMDSALSVGVLVLANSPVFRGVSQIRTVKDAVARLGIQEVARISAALSTRSLYQAGVRAEFELFGPIWNGLYYHAVTVARAVSELAHLRRIADPEQVFVAGMLHDVGKSIALRSLAALVIKKRIAKQEMASIDRVIHRVHVEVGGEVHREWLLPDHLIQIAVRHHDANVPTVPENVPIHLVRMVSALNLVRSHPNVHADALSEITQSANALGISPERVVSLNGTLAETEEWVRMLFGDDKGGPSSSGR